MDVDGSSTARTAGTQQYRSRRELLETHLARLEGARDDVSRSRVRTPWLLLGLLAVIPAGALWGSIGALGAFLTFVSIPLMGRYVTWAHQQEYSSQQDAIRRQLADLDYAFAHGAPDPVRWRVEGKRAQW